MGKSKWCTIFLSVQPNRLRVKYFDKVIFSVLLLILTKEKSRIAWFWMESGNLLLPWVEFESLFLEACINIFQNFSYKLNCLSPCLLKKILFSFYQEAHMSFFLEFQSSLLKAWMKFWKFLQHMCLLMKIPFKVET